MNDQIIQMLPAENLSRFAGMYQWGIDVITVIQTIKSPALTAILKFVTALGTEAFYVPVILFIFWWIDGRRGLGFGILIILSAWLNSFMKDLLKQPRPFNLEPSLGLAHESSYGAPSGHAQMSLTFWIPMAAWLSEKLKKKRAFIWTGAVFFILLIAFTRLYLGVHFPTDIFLGWILGGIVLAVWFIPGPRLQKLFASAGIRSQNICAAVIALVMNGLHPADRTLPALFLGFCVGYTLMRKRFPFFPWEGVGERKYNISMKVFRCIIGFSGLGIIFICLRLILPGEESLFSNIPLWGQNSPFYELGRFVRYGLVGLWVSAGAPLVFKREGSSLDANTAGGPGKEDPK